MKNTQFLYLNCLLFKKEKQWAERKTRKGASQRVPLTYRQPPPISLSLFLPTLPFPFPPYKFAEHRTTIFHQTPAPAEQPSPAMDASLLLSVALAVVLIPLSLALLNRLRLGRLPPGPRPWPVLGNLRQIKPIRCRCFQEWADRYGPVISVWFGSGLTVVVSTSELAKEVLKENDQQLADRPRNRSTQRFSRNGQDLIWADYGPHYIKVRKLCNLELFTPKRLEALRPIREDEVTAMVESVYRAATAPGESAEISLLLLSLDPGQC